MSERQITAILNRIEADLSDSDENDDPAVLHKSEAFWRNLQPWLSERGYKLRPRYQPDWSPSWKKNGRRPKDCEDGLEPKRAYLIDATRAQDGMYVVLKRLTHSFSPLEVPIGNYLSSVPLRNDPKNHCVPFLEVLDVPNDEATVIIVMPFLRPFDDPPFGTIGEVFDCLIQLFEGLEFMHKHRIAHRDCSGINFMIDPKNLFPVPVHPVAINKSRDLVRTVRPFSRSERPPKYYIIDFGISVRYEEDQLPVTEDIVKGADKTVPEYETPELKSDPFAIDVYLAGNLVRQHFVNIYRNLAFLDDLVANMVQDAPAKRPSMTEVVASFEKIRQAQLSKLNYRLAKRSEFMVESLAKDVQHSVRGLFRRSTPRPKSVSRRTVR